jgi:hypothetical protein
LELPKSVESSNLSLNKAVIRWMSVQSMVGMGTTVMVELPLPDASVWENVHAAA